MLLFKGLILMFIQSLVISYRLLLLCCLFTYPFYHFYGQVLPSSTLSPSGRIIIKYDQKFPIQKKTEILNEFSLKVYADLGESGIQILTIDDHQESSWNEEVLIELLNDYPGIASAESDQIVTALNNPSDSAFQYQWGLHNTGQNGTIPGADIGAINAWANETGSEDMVMAIIDSGVDWTHPDLGDNIWQNIGEDVDGDGRVLEYVNGTWVFDPDDIDGIDGDSNGYVDDFIGWNFRDLNNDPMDDHIQGHGTHVAGIAGARGNNGEGISGVSWRSKIMPLKFLDENGTGYLSDALIAFNYALFNGARISNHSWGTYEFNSALNFYVWYAQLRNHLVVTAAGNQFGSNNDLLPVYPSSFVYDNVISVTASNGNDEIASFSNIGNLSVDIAAPGEGIYSTLPGRQYGYINGTSMAAPFVTGTASLILAHNPDLTPSDIKQIIMHTATSIPEMGDKVASGGRLNLDAAINYTYYLDSCELKTGFHVSNFNICEGDTITLTNTSNQDFSTTFTWLVNGVLHDSTYHTSIPFPSAGTQEISLVSANGTCVDTLTRKVIVVNPPIVNLEDTSICARAFTLHAGVEQGVNTYAWSDTSNTLLGTTEALSITNSGVYILTIIDQCSNTFTDSVIVNLEGDCVWPGDVNTDGEVNMMDFIAWGHAFGDSGTARIDTGISFKAHEASEDWQSGFDSTETYAPNVNSKYADCDGNGIVDSLDLVAIVQNSTLDCNINPSTSSGTVALSIQTFQEEVDLEDTLYFEVHLTDFFNVDVDSVTGLLFSVNSNIPLEKPLSIDTDSSWMGIKGENLTTLAISENSLNNGQSWNCTHAGLVRTDKKSGSGSGKIAESLFIITIRDFGEISSFEEQAHLLLSVNQGQLIKSDGSIVSVNTLESQSSISVVVNFPPGDPEVINAGFEIRKWYPNPATESSTLEVYSQNETKNTLQLYNMMGSLIYEEAIELRPGINDINISTNGLPSGMYFSVIKGKESNLYSDLLVKE